ncbi:MAG: hypothetical protein GOVbin1753_106 [Prokaryotic dsDNA virus sp.]|nr:MAG: hypothetical protein GOVbin1753_106 [Prokaryotic dsDNA virus sp.]|tara:strand:+ start:3291 stop:3482 length:192 start_codon:yes stop_codon:yes gene_type:complete
MTPEYKFYIMGKLRGITQALNIVNRRNVDSATVKWLVREKEELTKKLEHLDLEELNKKVDELE